jgi:hypothetical protein
MVQYGTRWPPMDGGQPFDLTSDIEVSDLLLMHPAFVELDLSKQTIYTVATLLARAAKQSRSGRVLDQRGASALYHCVRSLAAELVGRRIFLMEDALAQAVVYGGKWRGEHMHGWHGIETLTVGEAKAKFGGTTVSIDDDCVRVTARHFHQAIVLAAAWDPRYEASRPDEFGVLAPYFWNENRHARLVCRTFAGFRPPDQQDDSAARIVLSGHGRVHDAVRAKRIRMIPKSNLRLNRY